MFSPIEENEHSPTSTISSESNPTPPDPSLYEEDEQDDDQPPEHVTLNLAVSEDGELCTVEMFVDEGQPIEEPPEEPAIIIAIREAQERLEDIKAENAELHRRVLGALGRRRSIVDADMLEGQDFFYQSNLAKWLLLKDELKQLRQSYRDEIDQQHDLLRKTQVEAREAAEVFLGELLQGRCSTDILTAWIPYNTLRIHIICLTMVAREAQHSVSGQILSEVVLTQLRERNKHATVEVEKCRIIQRQLQAHLYKLDQARKKKDQLPEGLHLVDYEQLKMENESLAEKIHAKNEEIIIMRKKRTATVHALSHVREKLQFVEKDTKIVADRLDEVERGLHQGRIDLHNLKSRCEHISQKKQRLQKSMVNISDPLLLDDLENLKDDAEATEEIIYELRQRYNAVHKDMKSKTKYVNSHKRAQMKAAEQAEAETDSTVTTKHNLRWGEERPLVGRQKL